MKRAILEAIGVIPVPIDKAFVGMVMLLMFGTGWVIGMVTAGMIIHPAFRPQEILAVCFFVITSLAAANLIRSSIWPPSDNSPDDQPDEAHSGTGQEHPYP